MPQDNLDQLASSLLGKAETFEDQSVPVQIGSPISSEEINSTIFSNLDMIKQFSQPAIDEWNQDNAPTRETGLAAVPGNLILDTVDFGKGIGTLGNLGIGRAREMIFDGSNPIRVFDEVGRGGKQLPSDIPVAGAVGQAIVADAYNTWAKPFVEKGLDGFGDIVEHINKHPGFAAADLSIAGGLAAKGLKAAGVTDKLAQYGSALKTKLPQGVQTSMAANEAIKPAAQGYANAMRRAAGVFDQMMDPLWAKLTKEEQKAARAFAEGWHPDILTGKPISFAMKNFLDATEAMTKEMARVLIESGVKTAEEIEAARYLPFILENTRLADGSKVFQNLSELIYQPELMRQYVQMSKEMLDAVGYKPKYNPWITDAEAARATTNPTKLSSGAFKEAARQIFDPEKDSKFGRFLDKGSAGEHVGPNHLKNLKAAFLQVNQFDEAIHTILKQALNGVNNPKLYQGPLKKLTIENNVLIENHINRILQGMSDHMPHMGSAAKALGKEIVLPESVHDALIKMMSSPERVQAGLFGKWASMQKRYLLGLNPLYAKAQGIQQGFQLLLFQFNGIKDILPSFWSWALGSQRELRAMIPEEIVQSVQLMEPLEGVRLFEGAGNLINKGAKQLADIADGYKFNGLSGRIEKAGEIVQKGLTGIDRLADINMQESAAYDAATRAVASIYYLNEIASKNEQAAKVFNGMVDTTIMKKRLQMLKDNPELQAEVLKKVDIVLGDFRTMPGKYQQLFSSAILWNRYYIEFSKMYASLVKNHPYKNAGLSHFATTAPILFGDKDLPEFARGAVVIPGSKKSDGTIQVDSRGSLTPLATIGEFAAAYSGSFGSDTTDTASVINSMNGALSMLIVISGRNPNTLRPFRQYSKVQDSSGQSFDPEDLRKGQYKPQTVTPDYIEYAARTIFAFPMKEARALSERAMSGGEASDFTSIMPVRISTRTKNMIPFEFGFKSEPKRKSGSGEIMEQRPLLESLDEFINMKPLTLDTNRQQESNRYKQLNLRKLNRKANRLGL